MPQIGGMYEGDRSRKQTLVEYGPPAPSALDNRPQTFDEFLKQTPQIVFVSATPGEFEHGHSSRIVEQIVRPTRSGGSAALMGGRPRTRSTT